MTELILKAEDYKKGFNEGYLFAKHMPELAEQLTKAVNESSRSEGFKDGSQQFLTEKTKEHYPSWLTGKKENKQEIKPDKMRDKDLDKE